jgi:hypothetical protein
MTSQNAVTILQKKLGMRGISTEEEANREQAECLVRIQEN